MRNASTNVVYELIKNNPQVVALTADNRNDIYEKIHLEYPQNYIDYGIAESNMIASAAGLAACGKIPFLYTITNFMSMRAYEFIRNDVCAANRNVKFLGRSSGLVSSNMGMTHQGTEELALLRSLPNLLVITPATPLEAKMATYAAFEYEGPVYIRLEGNNETELYDGDYRFEIGKGSVLREGQGITVMAMGSIVYEALIAAEYLERCENIQISVVHISTVKPIDKELIINEANKSGLIITLEEHTIYGGLGSAVAEVLAEERCKAYLVRMGLNGFCNCSGSRKEIREINGIDSSSIVKTVQKYINRVG